MFRCGGRDADWCGGDPLVGFDEMSARSHLATIASLLALAFGVSACERGCLATWLRDRSASPSVGGESPRGSTSPDAAFDLTGTDCSSGLARCIDSRIEVSVAAHVKQRECPWEVAAHCDAGCVKDALEVVAIGDVARVQLCATAEPLLRPLLPAESTTVTICADEVVSCAEGVVRSCPARGQTAHLVAGCVNGCAPGIGVDPGDLLTGAGAAAILCRRAHAERK